MVCVAANSGTSCKRRAVLSDTPGMNTLSSPCLSSIRVLQAGDSFFGHVVAAQMNQIAPPHVRPPSGQCHSRHGKSGLSAGFLGDSA